MNGTRTRRSPMVGVVGCVIAGAVFVAACSGEDPLPTQAEDRLEQSPSNADLAVTGAFDTNLFRDQSIVLPGDIVQVVGPGVFRFAGELIAADSVLVVAPPGDVIEQGAHVRVVGTVVRASQLTEAGIPDGVDPSQATGDEVDVILATEVRLVADVDAESRDVGG